MQYSRWELVNQRPRIQCHRLGRAPAPPGRQQWPPYDACLQGMASGKASQLAAVAANPL